MKIATWNVNSIIARLPHVTRWLEAAHPDALCIQETKCADEKFPLLELKATGYECIIYGQQSYNGVAILSRGGCGEVTRGFPGDDGARQDRLLATEVAGISIVHGGITAPADCVGILCCASITSGCQRRLPGEARMPGLIKRRERGSARQIMLRWLRSLFKRKPEPTSPCCLLRSGTRRPGHSG